MDTSVVQINTGAFTNVFLIRGRTGYVLVDASFPGRADCILAALARHGVAPEDIRLILLTHGHVDHFGSAAALRERTGAPVAIHVLDAEGPRRGTHVPDSTAPTGRLLSSLMRLPPLQKSLAAAAGPAFEPDILFSEGFRLDEYGVAGRVVHLPGHTPGSVSVLLDNGEAIVGDLVMGKLMGLIPRPGPPIVAWDLERNRESVDKLITLAPRIVYVGHGGPFRDLSGLTKQR